MHLRGTLDLILSRQYASDETFVGPLGRSIATSIDVSITETPEGELVYLQSVHRRIRFARPSLFPHIWTRNDADKNLALSFANLDILLLKEDGLFRRFTRQPDGVWRLAAIEDRNGNRITLERDPRGLITRIDHPDGLSLAVDNDAAGRRTASPWSAPTARAARCSATATTPAPTSWRPSRPAGRRTTTSTTPPAGASPGPMGSPPGRAGSTTPRAGSCSSRPRAPTGPPPLRRRQLHVRSQEPSHPVHARPPDGGAALVPLRARRAGHRRGGRAGPP